MKKHAEKCRELLLPNVGADCNCDGYHTFDELYDHRISLWIALCRTFKHTEDGMGIAKPGQFFVWRSKNHDDGTPAFGGGWFVLGMGKGKGTQMTYHLPLSRWEETNFADTLDQAPEWDGHSSDDVLQRLKAL